MTRVTGVSEGQRGQQAARSLAVGEDQSRMSTQPGGSHPAGVSLRLKPCSGLDPLPTSLKPLLLWGQGGLQHYLEPTEAGMEVVEGQDTVVDCQEAEEPGGTDQEKEQKGATKGPAMGTRKDTGGLSRLTQGSCKGHRRMHWGHTGDREGKKFTKEHGGLRRTLGQMRGHRKNQVLREP